MPVYHDTNHHEIGIESAKTRLAEILVSTPEKLRAMDDQTWDEKPAPDKWSKKEILGHLIDSASSNHHRFIRAQSQVNPTIRYAQVEWVRDSRYQLMPIAHIIDFWEAYNRHILFVWQYLPDEMLDRTCDVGDEVPRSLSFIIHDYVGHLEHHVSQILTN